MQRLSLRAPAAGHRGNSRPRMIARWFAARSSFPIPRLLLMRERKTGNTGPTPWHVPVAVEDIPEDGQHYALIADPAVRAELARMANVRGLPRVEVSFDVARSGSGGLHVVGHVSA